MVIRFADNMISNIGDSGFIVRNRIPRVTQIAIAFLAIFLLIYLSYLSGNRLIFSATLFVLVATICVTTIVFAEKLRALVLASEFQNALLSSGIRLGTRFCIIVKNDGNIVYMDPGFYQTFPELQNSDIRTIEAILANTEVPEDLREDVKAVLDQKRSEQILLPFKKADGGIMNIVTTIDMLPRPKFYFVIRGRDYIEKRDNKAEEQTDQPQPVDLPPQNVAENNLDIIELARPLYDNTETVIIANKAGEVIFISPNFEQWLGYDKGEIIISSIKISQIFNQYIGNNMGKKSLGDFNGEVISQKKDRSLMPVEIKQTAINKDGEIIGISAAINLS